jgi:hypothetical protein
MPPAGAAGLQLDKGLKVLRGGGARSESIANDAIRLSCAVSVAERGAMRFEIIFGSVGTGVLTAVLSGNAKKE